MFNRVAIIGVGLLGGSLARDLKRLNLAETIVGVCRSSATAELALEQNVVDHILPIEQAIVGADLIVFATPMQIMLPLLEKIHSEVAADAIITDVGSVKTDLYLELKRTLPHTLRQFVLAHPIAGGEHSGVAASKHELFTGKHVIVTNTDEVDKLALSKVGEMWDAVGAKVVGMSLQQHDAIFAKTSHLPHVVAFSLVNYLSSQPDSEQLFDLAAAGFYDFTRIASSDAEMWRDICITNKQEVLGALDGFVSHLNQIRKNIDASDQQGILEYFDAAKEARNKGLLKKQSS